MPRTYSCLRDHPDQQAKGLLLAACRDYEKEITYSTTMARFQASPLKGQSCEGHRFFSGPYETDPSRDCKATCVDGPRSYNFGAFLATLERIILIANSTDLRQWSIDRFSHTPKVFSTPPFHPAFSGIPGIAGCDEARKKLCKLSQWSAFAKLMVC